MILNFDCLMLLGKYVKGFMREGKMKGNKVHFYINI